MTGAALGTAVFLSGLCSALGLALVALVEPYSRTATTLLHASCSSSTPVSTHFEMESRARGFGGLDEWRVVVDVGAREQRGRRVEE